MAWRVYGQFHSFKNTHSWLEWVSIRRRRADDHERQKRSTEDQTRRRGGQNAAVPCQRNSWHILAAQPHADNPEENVSFGSSVLFHPDQARMLRRRKKQEARNKKMVKLKQIASLGSLRSALISVSDCVKKNHVWRLQQYTPDHDVGLLVLIVEKHVGFMRRGV